VPADHAEPCCTAVHGPRRAGVLTGGAPGSAACARGKAVSITLRNQPAFVGVARGLRRRRRRPRAAAAPVADRGSGSRGRAGKLDAVVDVPGGVGQVTVDIAYGGMWYCVVDAASVGLELLPEVGPALCTVRPAAPLQVHAAGLPPPSPHRPRAPVHPSTAQVPWRPERDGDLPARRDDQHRLPRTAPGTWLYTAHCNFGAG
jgi:hypothetical protein